MSSYRALSTPLSPLPSVPFNPGQHFPRTQFHDLTISLDMQHCGQHVALFQQT